MTRLRSRLLVPALALIVLAFLFPALAKALPKGETEPPAAERQETTHGSWRAGLGPGLSLAILRQPLMDSVSPRLQLPARAAADPE